ncbi:hypothetical protein RB195_005182 [Necator americanus]|uniref:Piwi domain-containing protein n=1 Tax=Necator americanus TaxID=51031 RepID=A0ABR1BLL9_NECAM
MDDRWVHNKTNTAYISRCNLLFTNDECTVIHLSNVAPSALGLLQSNHVKFDTLCSSEKGTQVKKMERKQTDQSRRPRNSRRRRWKHLNGSSHFDDGIRQPKCSINFLPRHLQETNPWEEAEWGHIDFSDVKAQGHVDDRGDHIGNSYERSNRRDCNCTNNYYGRERDEGRIYEERRERGGCSRRNGNGYRDGDGWDDREHGKSGFLGRLWERDREFGESSHHDKRYSEDSRNSCSRGPVRSPERLTREQWRQLERDIWNLHSKQLIDPEKNRDLYSFFGQSRYSSRQENDRSQPSSNTWRNCRRSAYDENRPNQAQRLGGRRKGRGCVNNHLDKSSFNDKKHRNGFKSSWNTDDHGDHFVEDHREPNSRDNVQVEFNREEEKSFDDESANKSDPMWCSQEDEDIAACNTSCFENLSIQEGQNSTVVENSDTESEGELKSRQESTTGSNTMPVTSSTPKPLPSSLEEPNAVVLAAKKSPAKRQGKQKVHLLTNFWELSVESKVVYRYDVVMYLGTPTDERAIDLLRGPRDDSAATERQRLCMDALRYALEFYRILSQYSAVVHDGAAMMFSSKDLANALKEHSGVLTLDKADLPESIRRLICRVDVSTVTIEITPCRTAAASFNMADLSAQMNRNWAALDRSWKQFYDLITNQDAVFSGHFTQFGAGCLYYSSPLSERVGFGYERFSGARKGIKFIEGKKGNPSKVVAALILDHRVGTFFKNQNLMKSVRELSGLRNVDRFDFSHNGYRRINKTWSEVNQYVKGVRMNYLGSGTNPISFMAIGISEVPIKDLKDTLPHKARTEISVLTKFSDTKVDINPNWPAVKRRIRGGVQYFPMELLEVAPHQRVSLEKQQIANTTPRADKPDVRLSKINSLLEALNLHDCGSKNLFLKAFGVKFAPAPKRVEGLRREAPGITFGNNRSLQIDKIKYNWKQERETKYVNCASVDRVLIVHSDRTFKLPNNVEIALSMMFKNRGIRCNRFEKVHIRKDRDFEMEKQLQKVFEANKDSKSILIIYIDRAESKSHEFLKLMERKYLIPTQQITAELAEKIKEKPQSCGNFVSKTNLKLGGINYEVIPESFAKNRWIAGGKTLVVGYDVAHPGKPTRDEIMNKMPPLKPSVVGFSFNGATHPESFIGDYHFQTPRREKVEDCVLNARFKWILELFRRNRSVWPERVVITRDGVSEGQYRMVVEDELGAIKEACMEFGNLHGRESWMPLFTVVVATKRHNARFFVEKGKYIENPQPATVVDTDVVRNDITEFYMLSHRPVQGTAKSTSYQVIVDENDMSSDEVQSLMLALSFHHQIVDAPVSLPEPVYQADEWAKRGKDIWKAYTDRHDLLLMEDRGEYAARPIDFEAMTSRLAYWKTNLEDRRVNA